MSQIHGLFSGGKKREVEVKIDSLEHEQKEVERNKQTYASAAQAAKNELTKADAAVAEAKAQVSKVEADLRKKELTQWTDESVIAAAAAERKAVFAASGNIPVLMEEAYYAFYSVLYS